MKHNINHKRSNKDNNNDNNNDSNRYVNCYTRRPDEWVVFNAKSVARKRTRYVPKVALRYAKRLNRRIDLTRTQVYSTKLNPPRLSDPLIECWSADECYDNKITIKYLMAMRFIA